MPIIVPPIAADASTEPPWYRQGWPWFLISIPLSSVIVGFMMLWLGLNSNQSLVVDDYYKEGKAINQRIARDRVAAVLGLQATLVQTQRGLELSLSKSTVAMPATWREDARLAEAAYQPPGTIGLRWVHATQQNKDGFVLLTAIEEGRYLAAQTELPTNGRWRFHIEPVPGQWRLVSDMLALQPGDSVTFNAPALSRFSPLHDAEKLSP